MIDLLYATYILTVLLLIPALAVLSARKCLIENTSRTVLTSVGVTILNSLSGPYTLITYSFFVISSSMLTRLGSDVKLKLGHRDILGRSWKQVIGVGLIPGIVNVASLLSYIAGLRQVAARLALAALALYSVSTADTWSSEIGMLYRKRPRLIVGLREAEPGTSGAVTPLGTLMSLLGSLATSSIGVISVYYLGDIGITVSVKSPALLLLLLALAGLLGDVIDSVLGCLIQEKRKCQVCGIICEKSIHCGVETIHVRGCRRFSGEVINALTQLILLAVSYVLLKLAV